MRAADRATRAPCHTCAHRTWRSVDGFMVMGCGPHGWRFGIATDIRRGHVNKAGQCVAMPAQCAQGEASSGTAAR